MKTLYLCEKPSQARVLAKQLGITEQVKGGYVGHDAVVTFCFGNMQTLAEPDTYIGDKSWALVDLPILPDAWAWKVNEKHREQFEVIGELLASCHKVVIATDPDDEGEVIGRELLKAHQFNGEVLRLWQSALTPDSLGAALQNLKPLSFTDALYRRGMIRRELDWLFGMNYSRAFSVLLDTASHIGRVKTQLLAELCEKEAFVIQPPKLESRLVAHDMAFVLANGLPILDDAVGCVVSLNSDFEIIPPPLPFSLSGLLLCAYETFGIGLKDGYQAAQNLYEAEAISYPRTSSNKLPAAGSAFAVHHAIMNTLDECPRWGDEVMKQMFGLVRDNGVMQDLGAARLRRVTTDIEVNGALYRNVITSVIEDEAGWLLMRPDQYAKFDMPKPFFFVPSDQVELKLETYALPDNYHTEGTLLKWMMARDVGTEATRVGAISSLLDDKVAYVQDGNLRPSALGKRISASLPTGFVSQMSDFVRLACQQSGLPSFDRHKHLLSATKWLSRTIHGGISSRPTI